MMDKMDDHEKGHNNMSPRDFNLFSEGEEDSHQDEERRMKIVEELLIKDFNLAFRVLYEFK